MDLQFRYSEASARRAQLRALRRDALPATIGILAVFAFTIYASAGKPAWRIALRVGNMAFAAAATAAVMAGMRIHFVQSIVYKLTPGAFSAGETSIPRDAIRTIELRPYGALVRGAESSQKIGFAVELEGYNELLDALRTWAPPATEWKTVDRTNLRPWLFPALVIPLFAFIEGPFRINPRYFYLSFGAAMLLSPLFLPWRKLIPPPYHWWVVASTLFTGAALLALGLFLAPK